MARTNRKNLIERLIFPNENSIKIFSSIDTGSLMQVPFLFGASLSFSRSVYSPNENAIVNTSTHNNGIQSVLTDAASISKFVLAINLCDCS